MSRPWYEQNPESYAAVRREVEDAYPELHFIHRGPSIFIRGCYPLFEGDRVWDRYQIELQLPEDSPRGLPIVREIGSRIPSTEDRHMEPNGKACVVLPDAFWYEYPQGISLLKFLNGPVCSFFVNQSLVDLGESNVWKDGEWGHGAGGIIEFYATILGTNDPRTILAYLGILKRDTVKGHWSCPCGSNEKLRKCHQALINELRARIPQAVVAKSEERLAESLARSGSTILSRYGAQRV